MTGAEPGPLSQSEMKTAHHPQPKLPNDRFREALTAVATSGLGRKQLVCSKMRKGREPALAVSRSPALRRPSRDCPAIRGVIRLISHGLAPLDVVGRTHVHRSRYTVADLAGDQCRSLPLGSFSHHEHVAGATPSTAQRRPHAPAIRDAPRCDASALAGTLDVSPSVLVFPCVEI